MRAIATAVGLLVAGALAAALVLLLGAAAPQHDLYVEHRSAKPYQLSSPARGAAAEPQIGPQAAHGRIVEADYPVDPTAGLFLRTWSVVYGRRWHREVTLPHFGGPLLGEGEEVCGHSLWLGAGLFDTSGAGAGLKEVIDRKLAGVFPRTVPVTSDITVRFAQIRKTSIRIMLHDDVIWFIGHLVLRDGRPRAHKEFDSPTELHVWVPIRLKSRAGAPWVEVGKVSVKWTGHTKAKLRKDAAAEGAEVGSLLGALIGLIVAGPPGALIGGGAGALGGSAYASDKVRREADSRASGVISKELQAVLRDVNRRLWLLKKPFAPFSGSPSATVRVRLADNPVVAQTGITFPLCLATNIGKAEIDPAITGPPIMQLQPLPKLDLAQTSPAAIVVRVDGNGMNQLLHFLWQIGVFRQWGRSSVLLDQLPEEMKSLAFDVTGFDPELPPVVHADVPQGSSGALAAVLANVKVGEWDQRTVLAQAGTRLAVRTARGKVRLSGEVEQLYAGCAERVGHEKTLLTPCLSDLLPIARERLEAEELAYELDGAELLEQLPELAFAGLQLSTSGLTVATSTDPVTLDVRVNAEIHAAAK